VAGNRQRPIVGLAELVAAAHPEVGNAEAAIRSGAIEVDGAVVVNPRSRVRRDAVIKVSRPRALRGAAKLTAALDHFGIDVTGRAALDLGAASGGFTSVLLERGARLVYAVDVGYGLLLGSLRQDQRVRNLERTNLAELNTGLVPDRIGVLTADLSYLSVASAIGQVETVDLARGADLVALIKPMFELGLGALPAGDDQLREAVDRAVAGVRRWPWQVRGVIRSPVSGAHGAVEFLLHAQRQDAAS
jgi:23S rRNA (cytidine1920-2'-O)/16S rRNA (cytidine1409-2'-O)-methyltransferase